MGLAVEFITAGVALLAITLTVAQYVTAHRPYLSVTRLHIGISTPTRELYLQVDITNLGRIPAKKVTVKVTQIRGGGDDRSVVSEQERTIGAVFPDQTIQSTVGGDFTGVEQYDSGEEFHVTISYEGPIAFGGRKRLGYGRYFTFQPLYVDRDGWAAVFDRAADFK